MHAKFESLLPGTAITPAMRFNMRTRSQRGTEHRCFFGQQVEPYQDPCPKSWKTCRIYKKPSGNKKPAWNRAEASIRAAGRSLPFTAAIPQNTSKSKIFLRSQNPVNSIRIMETYKHIRDSSKYGRNSLKIHANRRSHTNSWNPWKDWNRASKKPGLQKRQVWVLSFRDNNSTRNAFQHPILESSSAGEVGGRGGNL